jgi:molybdate/tungstate transport system ATP-binding protein
MIDVDRLNLTVGDLRGKGRSFSLRDVTFSVSEGEYFVLLGKSGSGKTLLLETLCGLNRAESGRISIGDLDVTDLEPRRRGIGYLPQDYALFPHLTVYRNVAYGLFGRDLGGEDRTEKTTRLLKEMGIDDLADRHPEGLSGGEKQRVALARAMAVDPRLLVLDEPVSALDEQTRDSLCRRLKQFQRSRGTTSLHVCHNFNEMLQVADRVAVMANGTIVQTGTPQDILQRPTSVDVARLAQPGNLFTEGVSATHRDGRVWLQLPGKVEIAAAPQGKKQSHALAAVMIREENIRLLPQAPNEDDSRATILTATIKEVTDLGSLIRLNTVCNDRLSFVVTQSKNEYAGLGQPVGGRVFLRIVPEDVHVIPK